MHWVLVHGAWHGAWCWQRVTDELHARHISWSAPDLPGHGDNPVATEQIDLDSYVDHVCRWVRELDRRVVLVGHSMGGAVITRVAECLPSHVASLVYVCAFLPRDGESLGQLGQEDQDSLLNGAIRPGATAGTLELDPEQVTSIFYHDCRGEDAELALTRLTPQAIAPLRQPVHCSDENWGSVPRGYVLCRADRAITPTMQERMCDRVPCDPVVEMDSGHSPFFSNPVTLVESILRITAAHDVDA